MTYKSDTQPLCRWCGAAIPKFTTGHGFGKMSASLSAARFYTEKPTTKAEVQRLIGNESVTSVRYGPDGKGGQYIWSANSWDGQSYRDRFFCNGEHAKAFGYAMADEFPRYGGLGYMRALAKEAKEAAA